MTEINKKKPRSAAYPAYNLGEVIESFRNLRKNLGKGPYSRKSMAIGLGYNSVTGSSASKIAACVHFGLADRDGSAYKESDLSSKIFTYTNEYERNIAIVDAFLSPVLYSRLAEEYNGKAIPNMLENILVRNYGIQEKAAAKAADCFKKSAEYAGVLKNGVLNIHIYEGRDVGIARGESEDSKEIAVQLHDYVTNDEGDRLSDKNVLEEDLIKVDLPSGVAILYPKELASDFIFGAFAEELKALDQAIKKAKATDGDSSTQGVDEM